MKKISLASFDGFAIGRLPDNPIVLRYTYDSNGDAIERPSYGADRPCPRCLDAIMGVDGARHCGNCDCCKSGPR